MTRWFVVALACTLEGCFPSGTREAQRFYVLEAAGAGMQAKASRASTLLVAPTTASSFYDTHEIVYSRAPGMRAYYQFNSWTERPGRRIEALLVERLQRGGAFETVAATSSGVKGALLLSTHVDELYHDAAATPGSARITLSAELIDPARRALVARRTFSRSAPATSYDAPGAVHAFSKAIDAILDDIAAWIDAAAPR